MSLSLVLRAGDEIIIGEARIVLCQEPGHGVRRVKLAIDAPKEVRVNYVKRDELRVRQEPNPPKDSRA